MSFNQMASELELLAKSRQPAEDSNPDADADDDKKDDKKIAEAAAGGGEAADELDGAAGSDDEGDKKGEEPMGKSFSAVIDGEEVQVLDATELIKSLSVQVERISAERTVENEALTKALTVTHSLLKSQGEEIVFLKSRLEELGSTGRGRKTVVTIAEKTASTLAKSQPAGIPAGELMAKCLAAQKSGRLSAFDVGRANIAIESGLAVPPDVVARLAE